MTATGGDRHLQRILQGSAVKRGIDPSLSDSAAEQGRLAITGDTVGPRSAGRLARLVG